MTIKCTHYILFHFYTLGGRLNQAETAILCDMFREKGYAIREFGQVTDVCVINTCSVTGHSGGSLPQYDPQSARRHPRTFLIVVGCYAQVGLKYYEPFPG
jgi:threonylcarbamoyladenosine tRNA methylthiotransferase MtaB